VELTPELNSGQALQGFINWFKQAKTISSPEIQFSDSLNYGTSKFYEAMQTTIKAIEIIEGIEKTLMNDA
jgi:hypothetical protein